MLRCAICDYTQDDGSFYADRGPSRIQVHHSDAYGDFLCKICENEIDENLSELSEGDDEED